jgi:hypothetical protein
VQALACLVGGERALCVAVSYLRPRVALPLVACAVHLAQLCGGDLLLELGSYGEPTANSADTLFGALNVMSIPATLVSFPPAARIGSPLTGETPRIIASSSPRLTGCVGERPRVASIAGEPCQRLCGTAADVALGVLLVAGVVVAPRRR